MSSYLSVALKNPREISFAGLSGVFSGLGQTAVISLLFPVIQSDLALSNQSFGGYYGMATLGSAFLLPWVGPYIDRISLHRFAAMAAFILAAGYIGLAATASVPLLLLSILCIRLGGQSCLSLLPGTSIGRFFTVTRGKAMALTYLGFSVGEVLWPASFVFLLARVADWRIVCLLIAATALFLFLPLGRLFLPSTSVFNQAPGQSHQRTSFLSGIQETIKPRFFWLLLPTAVMTAFLCTGFMLFQVSIASEKGWSLALIASSYTVFSAMRILTTIATGSLIDRFGAWRLSPYLLIPLTSAILCLIFLEGNWVAPAYLGCIGSSIGAAATLTSALWAELYRPESVGKVRSLLSTIIVSSTAVSPPLFGWALDHSVSLKVLGAGALLLILIASLGAFLAHPAMRETVFEKEQEPAVVASSENIVA